MGVYFTIFLYIFDCIFKRLISSTKLSKIVRLRNQFNKLMICLKRNDDDGKLSWIFGKLYIELGFLSLITVLKCYFPAVECLDYSISTDSANSYLTSICN